MGVDPDAVFYPKRLMNILDGKSVPQEGIYVVNCKFVDYGYFGNLEVFSARAFSTLLENLDTCYTELDWKIGVDGGKFVPWARTSLHRGAWTSTVSDTLRNSPSQQMALAQQTGPKTRRRTRSSSRHARS